MKLIFQIHYNVTTIELKEKKSRGGKGGRVKIKLRGSRLRPIRAALFFFMYLPDVEDIQSRAETVKALPDSLSCHHVTR